MNVLVSVPTYLLRKPTHSESLIFSSSLPNQHKSHSNSVIGKGTMVMVMVMEI